MGQTAEATGGAQHAGGGFSGGLKKRGHGGGVRPGERRVGPNKTGARGSFTISALAE